MRSYIYTCNAQIQRTTGLWYSAEYSTFSISDEVGKYRLTVAGYSGDAGNALMTMYAADWKSNGRMFCTPDSDNDVFAGSCAVNQRSGWWFGWCSASILNKDSTASWTSSNSFNDVQASRMLVRLI